MIPVPFTPSHSHRPIHTHSSLRSDDSRESVTVAIVRRQDGTLHGRRVSAEWRLTAQWRRSARSDTVPLTVEREARGADAGGGGAVRARARLFLQSVIVVGYLAAVPSAVGWRSPHVRRL